jgi:hypothetical protein
MLVTLGVKYLGIIEILYIYNGLNGIMKMK